MAITPTRPVVVASAASRDSGRTTPTTGTTPSSSAFTVSNAAAVAELQAITTSLAPRSTSTDDSSWAYERSCCWLRSPYGNRAVSPR